MILTITDLTDFSGRDFYCVAGLDADGVCYRPTKSYFSAQECRENGILPGARIEGTFRFLRNSQKPHSEDCSRADVRFAGNCAVLEFFELLRRTVSASLEEGFGVVLPDYKKCFPHETPPDRSIVTIKVNPRRCWFEISKDGKLKFSFHDSDNTKYPYVPIADLKIREYTAFLGLDIAARYLTDFVHEQKTVFLRIGLGRCHEINGRNGYWLQINGIYSFPAWIPGTRGLVEA
ncbi:hypothetical protein [Desulfolutivibrio sulfoxidireducens]|uniref:hypothetical protein n=1 Tax=Desulfolutivibrio sulfoxidireducens TaxID=2773299 RepID=UPI00159D2439|nr:hypothetical protein [Desulfolutivibrio sulfoxidireducens]QLA20472.1 hypothetical protein GD604_12525 [Desulfolutivibrio sulfoxidireducens]